MKSNSESKNDLQRIKHRCRLRRSRVRRNTPFFEFSLCLSRACLGKMFVFIYKWQLKKDPFRNSFRLLKRTICQDRLGTNRPKLQEGACFAGEQYMIGNHLADEPLLFYGSPRVFLSMCIIDNPSTLCVTTDEVT
jgi:hypothetical protein